MITTEIVHYCAKEVDRQHASPLDVTRMVTAWSWAHSMNKQRIIPTEVDIMLIAGQVVPDKVRLLIEGQNNYRTTPVVFNNSRGGTDASAIPGAMARCLEGLAELASPEVIHFERDEIVDPICRAILSIHPWEDGNGRTVSIVRNWLMGSLDDPEPLPDYGWD